MTKINSIPGHEFIKDMGRTKLRPGGGATTEWLLAQTNLQSSHQVLEVACNQGDNMIYMHTKYGCQVKGVDIDAHVVKECQKNIKILEFEKDIQAFQMDARTLDFPDESFDVIINEAMLTIFDKENKLKAFKEYYRVLKKGGFLLTHDAMPIKDDPKIQQGISRAIQTQAYPLVLEDFINLLQQANFTIKTFKVGEFLLLDKMTMINDEGPTRAAQILKNIQLPENKERFKRLAWLSESKQVKHMAIVSQKI